VTSLFFSSTDISYLRNIVVDFIAFSFHWRRDAAEKLTGKKTGFLFDDYRMETLSKGNIPEKESFENNYILQQQIEL